MLLAAMLATACGSGGDGESSPDTPPVQIDPQIRITGPTPFADGCDRARPRARIRG